VEKQNLLCNIFCLFLLCVFLQGCSPLMGLGALPFLGQTNERFVLGHLGSKTKIKLKTVTFSASNQANQNYPTNIHLVLLYDPHLISEFLKMSSDDYFSDRNYEQLQRDHTTTIKIYKYQVTPGSRIEARRVEYSDSPVAGFLFASYRTPGDHRIRIGENRHLMIMLDKDDWRVVPYESQT
jgi:type VI secretion system protein